MPGRTRFTIATLVCIASACAPQQETATPPADTAADVAAVRAVRDAEVAAITSRDMSLPYLAADAVLMPPGEPAVDGIDAIRTWFEAFMAQVSATSANYTSSNFNVSGDWAVEPYAGTLTVTPAGGGEAMTEALKGIHVYRRQADGSWKMIYDIWNANEAPPSM